MSGLKLSDDDLRTFAGRWVAVLNNRIISHGGTPAQALRLAKEARFKETPELFFVPMTTPIQFSGIFNRVCDLLPEDEQVYLVGGAVRDVLLGNPCHDLDFVLHGRTRQIAKRIADELGGALFPLDEARGMMRVLLRSERGERIVLDFAPIQGKSIDADLSTRDFTINAMAVDVRAPHRLLDPLGGARDLFDKQLRQCSPVSLRNDAVRILRGIRFAALLGLHIPQEERVAMRRAVPALKTVSPERIRDEFLTILRGRRVSSALRALSVLGVFSGIFPELESLKTVPIRSDATKANHGAWEEGLSIVSNLEKVMNALGGENGKDVPENLLFGEMKIHLGRYRRPIMQHLGSEIIAGRSVRPLIFLAALLRQITSYAAFADNAGGQCQGVAGSECIEKIGKSMILSNEEINRVKSIVGGCEMAARFRAGQPDRREIYRFFRSTGEAGVDACLLSLAVTMTEFTPAPPQDLWRNQLISTSLLFDAWWNKHEKLISPPKIISGGDLIAEFGLEPGPRIGVLLALVREAQASGEVAAREDALEMIRRILEGEE